MLVHVTSEDFPLTDAIRNFIDEQLGQVKTRLPDSARIDVFLKKDGPRDFRVIIKSHVFDHEVQGEGYGGDLYQDIRLAKQDFDQPAHNCVEKFRSKRHAGD